VLVKGAVSLQRFQLRENQEILARFADHQPEDAFFFRRGDLRHQHFRTALGGIRGYVV
jgi:hypothetical protein